MKKKYLIIGAVVLAIVGLFVYYRKKVSVNPDNPFSVNTATGIAARNDIREETTKVATGVVNSIKSAIEGKDTTNMTPEEKAAYTAELEKQKAEAVEINALKRAFYELTGTSAPDGGTVESYRSLFNVAKENAKKLQEYTLISGDNDFSDNNFVSVADIERAITVAKQQKEAKAKKEAEEAARKAQLAKEQAALEKWLRDTTQKFFDANKIYNDNLPYIRGIVERAQWSRAHITETLKGKLGIPYVAYRKYDTEALDVLISWGEHDIVAAQAANWVYKQSKGHGLENYANYKEAKNRSGASKAERVTLLYGSYPGIEPSPRWMLETKEEYQAFLRSINLEGKGYDWK